MSKTIGPKRFNTLKKQVDLLNSVEVEKACKELNITTESLHRSKRAYYQYLGKDENSPDVKVPKVLIFDLETSYMQGFFFSTFKPIIHHDNITVSSHLLCWKAKWLNEPEVFGDSLTPNEAKRHDDKRIAKSLWKAIDDADVILAHNLDKFDRKVANARFILNGLKPPSPYQKIDTLKIARYNFKHASNRLDYLGKILVRDEKIKTNNQLWIDCFYGVPEALDEMATYCAQDVLLLEEVYFELRPWMNSHPNLSLIAESIEETCPTCLSKDLSECGEYVTPAGRFDSVRCNKCGAISRRRKSNLSQAEKDSLLVSTAR